MNNEQIVQDFRRRYEGTFVHLELQKEETTLLAKIRTVEQDTSKVGILNIETQELGRLVLNLGSPGHALRFRFPQSGVFQHENDAVIFSRRPARQYRRGLCQDNSMILCVTHNIIGNPYGYTFKTLGNAFIHKTYHPEEALWMLRKGKKRSVALGNDLSISLSFETRGELFVIWYWDHPVAKCDRYGKRLEILEPVYASLIAQHFPQ